MKERMIPRSHGREIAELCVDVSEKAHYWRDRAKAAEAKLALLSDAAQRQMQEAAAKVARADNAVNRTATEKRICHRIAAAIRALPIEDVTYDR